MDIGHFTIDAAEGRVRELRRALKAGIDVNAKGAQNGWPALHWAVSKDARAAVQLLLANGADPNIQGKLGDTALHLAVLRQPHIPLLQQLLAAGADAAIPNKFGITALQAAQSIKDFPLEVFGNDIEGQ